MNSVAILDKLVAFPTVSAESNLELIDFAAAFLRDLGARIEILPNQQGTKANLLATIGPDDVPGVLLAGHTDVVPVTGQSWSADPFRMREEGARLYGRGTADMKGFLASALNAAGQSASGTLATPLHLALSYDEEIGCVGVRPMLEMLAERGFRPRFCIIGEPTSMQIALGHKGKTAARATCRGVAAHSALAPTGLNAIHLACDLISRLRDRQADLVQHGHRDDSYEVPYTTIHVGKFQGGVALNIVPDHAVLDFEIRNLAQDDGAAILAAISEDAAKLSAAHREEHPASGIAVEQITAYPGLEVPRDAEIVRFLSALLDAPALTKIAFGTEGGLYTGHLGVPAVVCGPGSMDQGHKPDEFVSVAQMALCDLTMSRLVDRLR